MKRCCRLEKCCRVTWTPSSWRHSSCSSHAAKTRIFSWNRCTMMLLHRGEQMPSSNGLHNHHVIYLSLIWLCGWMMWWSGCRTRDLEVTRCWTRNLEVTGCQSRNLEVTGCRTRDLEVTGCQTHNPEVTGCRTRDLGHRVSDSRSRGHKVSDSQSRGHKFIHSRAVSLLCNNSGQVVTQQWPSYSLSWSSIIWCWEGTALA